MKLTVTGGRGKRVGVLVIDDADADVLEGSSLNLQPSGYVQRYRDGQYQPLHRAILGLPAGRNPVVDHINGDKLDNRRANLRVVHQSDNALNRSGPNSNSTSGFRGVSWNKTNWRAEVRKRGIRYYQSFQDPMTAALWAAAKRLELGEPFIAPASVNVA